MGKDLLAVYCHPNEGARLKSVTNLDFWLSPNRSEYDLGDAFLVYNKFGGKTNLPMNRFVELESGVDIINGDFLILCKDDKGNYASVTDEVSVKYLNKFLHPEIFLFVNDKLHVIKIRYGTEYILTRTLDLFSEEKVEKIPDDVVVSKEEELNGGNR